MQRLLSFGCLLLGAVTHHSVTVGQVQVECNQWAVLHTQSAQGGSVDLQKERAKVIRKGVEIQTEAETPMEGVPRLSS